jgi:hypothetical protein
MNQPTYQTTVEPVRTHEAQSWCVDFTGIDSHTWLSPPKEPFDPDPDAERRWVERITVDERVLREDD